MACTRSDSFDEVEVLDLTSPVPSPPTRSQSRHRRCSSPLVPSIGSEITDKASAEEIEHVEERDVEAPMLAVDMTVTGGGADSDSSDEFDVEKWCTRRHLPPVPSLPASLSVSAAPVTSIAHDADGNGPETYHDNRHDSGSSDDACSMASVMELTDPEHGKPEANEKPPVDDNDVVADSWARTCVQGFHTHTEGSVVELLSDSDDGEYLEKRPIIARYTCLDTCSLDPRRFLGTSSTCRCSVRSPYSPKALVHACCR